MYFFVFEFLMARQLRVRKCAAYDTYMLNMHVQDLSHNRDTREAASYTRLYEKTPCNTSSTRKKLRVNDG